MVSADFFALHERNRRLSDHFTLFKSMGGDRRQGRIGKGGARNVVVPDDGEISGDGKPGFTNRHHCPDGQGVVAREQGQRLEAAQAGLLAAEEAHESAKALLPVTAERLEAAKARLAEIEREISDAA